MNNVKAQQINQLIMNFYGTCKFDNFALARSISVCLTLSFSHTKWKHEQKLSLG